MNLTSATAKVTAVIWDVYSSPLFMVLLLSAASKLSSYYFRKRESLKDQKINIYFLNYDL